MFEYYDKDKMLVPIKIWTESIDDIEESCLEQAINLANLPFAHDHIALMPDTHTGKGMPIGGVIACKNTVIPNAVGVDIGCGMAFVQTDIPVSILRDTVTGSGELIKVIVGNILRTIPVGFSHYGKPQTSAVLDKAQSEIERYNAEIYRAGILFRWLTGWRKPFYRDTGRRKRHGLYNAPFGKPNVRQHDRAVFQQDSP